MRWMDKDKLIAFLEDMPEINDYNYKPYFRKIYLKRDTTFVRKAVKKKQMKDFIEWYEGRFGKGSWERNTITTATTYPTIEIKKEI